MFIRVCEHGSIIFSPSSVSAKGIGETEKMLARMSDYITTPIFEDGRTSGKTKGKAEKTSM